MTAVTPVPDLQHALHASAAILIDAVADPAAIENSSLKHRADALNAVGRFMTMLYKYEVQPVPVQDAGEPAPVAASAAAAGIRPHAPTAALAGRAASHEPAPAVNRHERRKRERLLRRSS